MHSHRIWNLRQVAGSACSAPRNPAPHNFELVPRGTDTLQVEIGHRKLRRRVPLFSGALEQAETAFLVADQKPLTVGVNSPAK